MVCWASGCPPRLPALAQSTLTSFPKESSPRLTQRPICGGSGAKDCKLESKQRRMKGRLGLWRERDVPLWCQRFSDHFLCPYAAFDHLLGAPDMLCICRVCLYLLKLKLCEFIRCQRRTQPKRSSRYQVMPGMWQRGGRFDVLLLPCNCWCGISCSLRCHSACGKSSHCCDSFCLVLPS